MSQSSQLKDQFILSMPQLQSDYFTGSLIYLWDHSEEGAAGLVVNKPSEFTVGEILNQLNLTKHAGLMPATPVFVGGPVMMDRGFILHRPDKRTWKSSLQLREDLVLTTSIDILEALAEGTGPKDFLLALGYSGWGPGQLESELSRNLWLSCPANLDILFSTEPQQRLAAAARQMGIDINLLSDQTGHA